MKSLICLIAGCSLALTSFAQESPATDTAKKKKHVKLTIGSGGVQITTEDTTLNITEMAREEKAKKKESRFKAQWGVVDLGINMLDDQTNYNSPEARQFLRVGQDMQQANLFAQRDVKSVNVNIYPVMFRYRMLHTRNQQISLVSGVGMQLYNFRFNKPITYVNDVRPGIIYDSLHFTKNKLAFNYLSVPLSLQFKTRMGGKAWLVYGFGVSGGYRIASWTKQVSNELGKVKNHDPFNFRNFVGGLNAEIGVDGYFRLYATYQLSSMHEYALNQHPYCIGIRFMGL